MAPTRPRFDCTASSCSFLTTTPATISAAQLYAEITLPSLFSFSFEILNPTLSTSAGSVRNIVCLVDSVSGAALLCISATDTRALRFDYGSSVASVTNGPLLDLSHATTYTTVLVTVSTSSVKFATSADYSAVTEVAIPSAVNTAGRVYHMYLSVPTLPLSSGGSARHFNIGRKCTCGAV
jgi:hypothetical protein